MGVAVPDGVQGDVPVVSVPPVAHWLPDTEMRDRLAAYRDDLTRAADARVQEWKDISQELWDVLCNAAATYEEWAAAYNRVRERYEDALRREPSGSS